MPSINSWDNQVTNANVAFSGGTMNIGADATSGVINIGTGAAARTTTIGNVTGASALELKCGTGNCTLASAAGTVLQTLSSGIVSTPIQTAYTVVFGSEEYDHQGEYDTGTGIFTCGTAGIYLCAAAVCVGGLAAGHTTGQISFVKGATKYGTTEVGPYLCRDNFAQYSFVLTQILKCAAGETIYCEIKVSGSTKVVDVMGGVCTVMQIQKIG
jgi:hypothetical protein